MSNLQSLANQQRAAILAREQAARVELKREYDAVWLRCLSRLSWLFAALRDAKQHQQPLTLSWLAAEQRKSRVKAAIAHEIGQFAVHAHQATEEQKHAAREAGRRDALSLLQEVRRR